MVANSSGSDENDMKRIYVQRIILLGWQRDYVSILSTVSLGQVRGGLAAEG